MTQRFTRRISGGAIVIALSLSPAFAQSLDNKGTDFLMTFLPNESGTNTTELHLTADVATMVTIDYPAIAPTFSTTVAVAPGAITIVGVPNTASQAWVADSVQSNAVSAQSADEFVCYMVNRAGFTSDAALALPIDTMNTEFIAVGYEAREFLGLNTFSGEFAVVAAYDNTTVEITPPRDLLGRPAGVTFSVMLNAGEAYFGEAVARGFFDDHGDITGTIITSDRPVGMTSGNRCADVPITSQACDHIFEVGQPVQSWGDTIVVTNLPDRPSGSVYRILASVDGTTVSQDGASIGTINRGEFIETPMLPGSHVFTGTSPIFVTQYMTGQTSAGATTGDPAMGNMIPAAQYLSDYTFATVGDGQFALHFLTVIGDTADVGAILLDGVPIAPGAFAPIGATGLSAAVIPLDEGTHTTSSPGPHGITVEGFNSYDSYIYPGGALFQFINPVGDENEPICEVVATNSVSLSGRGVDDRPSEDVNGNGVLDPGEDLNGNELIDEDTGIFFVQLAPGSMNLNLVVDPFVPGDPEATFVASVIDPMLDGEGAIVVTDGAGNQCAIEVLILAETGCMHSGIGSIVGVDAVNNPTAFPTIQEAVNDPNQVQVLVFTGVYNERVLLLGKADFLLRACGDVTIDGLIVKSTLRTTVRGFNVLGTGMSTGVWMLGTPYASDAFALQECHISHFGAGIRMDSGGNVLSAQECSITECMAGFKTWDFRTQVVGGSAEFLSCDISGHGYDGAVVPPDMDVLFEGCTLNDNGKAAIAMIWYGWGAATPERVTLNGNTFAGNNNTYGPDPSTENIRAVADIIDATDAQPVY